MNKTFTCACIALFCVWVSLPAFGQETNTQKYQCVKTDNGAKLTQNDKTVWELVVKTPEGKPYIHPIALPDGQVITEIRPQDHKWHMGLWFSWKYINGVNYWEPSDGKTEVEDWSVEINGLSATAHIKLKYYNKKSPDVTVLSETRTILFSSPDEKGNYTITSKHHFTVGEKAAEFDRTPPWKHGGGYAGIALRMNDSVGKFKPTCSNGGTDMNSIRSQPASWADFRSPESGLGVHLSVLKGTDKTRIYLQNGGKNYIIPSPVHEGSITYQPGESFDLEYEFRLGE